MKKFLLSIFFLFLTSLSFAQGNFGTMAVDKASKIKTSTTNFNNNLSASDTNVQAALDTLDDNASGGAGSLTGLSDIGSANPSAGNILIADGASYNSVAVSGDISISSAGVATIGDDKIGSAELLSTSVTAGAYTLSNITVDDDGRITSASSGASSNTGGWTETYPNVFLTNSQDNVGIGTSTPTEKLHLSSSSPSGQIIDAYSSGIGGIDVYTVLSAAMDGTDGSTTFTDDSLSAHVCTAVSSGQIDTAQSKFGGASGLFGTTGSSSVSCADSSDWAYGTGDFEQDFWLRMYDVSVDQTFISQKPNGNNFFVFKYSAAGNLMLIVDVGGIDKIVISKAWSPSINTWYHVKLLRTGTTFRFFINGSQVGTDGTSSETIPDFSAALRIGDQTGAQSVNGWMDQVRISKGTARETTTFTPPTSAYTSSGGLAYTKYSSDGTTIFTVGIDGRFARNSLAIGTTDAVTNQRLLISSDGKVGIANTSPTEKLDVTGNIKASGSMAASSMTSTGSFTFSGVGSDIITGTNEHLSLMPNGTGNVGIGTSAPQEKLDVSGNIKASGSMAAGSITSSNGLTMQTGGGLTITDTTAAGTCTSSASTTCTATVRSECKPVCSQTTSVSTTMRCSVATTTLTCTFGTSGTNTCNFICF